jgi:rare lipoprotein A
LQKGPFDLGVTRACRLLALTAAGLWLAACAPTAQAGSGAIATRLPAPRKMGTAPLPDKPIPYDRAVGRAPATAERGGYSQTGTASWYGGAFHGRRTASGERFDKREMTVAHRTLPMGSRIEITNLKNGRTVVARVNDRGPFTKGRLVDVSKACAEALGFVDAGATKVRVRVLGPSRREPGMTALAGADTPARLSAISGGGSARRPGLTPLSDPDGGQDGDRLTPLSAPGTRTARK